MNNKNIKLVFLTIFFVFAVFATSACSGLKKEKVLDLPITAEWSFYYYVFDGNLEYRLLSQDRQYMPKFSSEDGKTFLFTINGEKFYEGDLIKNDDGTYYMIYNEESNKLTAVIDGDMLSISYPGRFDLVFLGDDE